MKVQQRFAQGPLPPTGAQLVGALNELEVSFLQGGTATGSSSQLEPAYLIAALASHREARLRLALIPLFLRHPAYAMVVSLVYAQLSDSAQLVLACYYHAAYLLQQKYHLTLAALLGKQAPLPDLFAQPLGLSVTPDLARGLEELAAHHALLSGRSINWLGTYEHAAQRFLANLEKQRQWQQ